MGPYQPRKADAADTAAIFRPFTIGRLHLKNRLLRSSISGRIDNYDGSGTPARVHFEEQFARGGVAAIISSHVPITPAARVLPNYAMIDRDERVVIVVFGLLGVGTQLATGMKVIPMMSDHVWKLRSLSETGGP